MEVARLTERDLPALAGLYTQFWGEESSPAKMLETFRRLGGNPSYIFLAARHDDRLVGSVTGIVCEELYGECRPFMVIEDVIVDKAHRRTGIGSELMRALEREAVSRGCAFVILVTENDRTEALRFYESLGYSPGAHRGFKKRLASDRPAGAAGAARPGGAERRCRRRE